MDHLNKKIKSCTKCNLCKNMPLGSCVPGIGPSEARIMLVGDALGRDEAILEEPFVGQCGQLLDKILLTAGLKRQELYITNAVKGRPTKNNGKANRPPSENEITACKDWLWKEIRLVKPKCIITLGKVPTYLLLASQIGKKYKFKLKDCVGVEYVVDFCDSRIFPAYHPSFLMLNGKSKVEETVNLFKELKGRFYDYSKAV